MDHVAKSHWLCCVWTRVPLYYCICPSAAWLPPPARQESTLPKWPHLTRALSCTNKTSSGGAVDFHLPQSAQVAVPLTPFHLCAGECGPTWLTGLEALEEQSSWASIVPQVAVPSVWEARTFCECWKDIIEKWNEGTSLRSRHSFLPQVCSLIFNYALWALTPSPPRLRHTSCSPMRCWTKEQTCPWHCVPRGRTLGSGHVKGITENPLAEIFYSN
jgi:hypothetical protein